MLEKLRVEPLGALAACGILAMDPAVIDTQFTGMDNRDQ